MLGASCSPCCSRVIRNYCGCTDIIRPEQVSFSVSFTDTRNSGARFGSSKSQTFDAQAGFDTNYWTVQQGQFETESMFQQRTAVLNQWCNWVNSIALTSTFQSDESSRIRRLQFQGAYSPTAPSGASAKVRVSASLCPTGLLLTQIECFSSGMALYLSQSVSVGFSRLASGVCEAAAGIRTYEGTLDFYETRGVDSSGCAQLLFENQYTGRLITTLVVETVVNPLP
jgi:hypothetical protein